MGLGPRDLRVRSPTVRIGTSGDVDEKTIIMASWVGPAHTSFRLVIGPTRYFRSPSSPSQAANRTTRRYAPTRGRIVGVTNRRIGSLETNEPTNKATSRIVRFSFRLRGIVEDLSLFDSTPSNQSELSSLVTVPGWL